MHAQFRMRCERGALELDMSLSPSPSAGITQLRLERTLPADERMRVTAERVLRALRGEAALEAEDEPVRKAVAHAALEHRDCTLADTLRGDGHAHSVFGLTCGHAQLELEIGVSDAGTLGEIVVRARRSGTGTCRP